VFKIEFTELRVVGGGTHQKFDTTLVFDLDNYNVFVKYRPRPTTQIRMERNTAERRK
jgi:hypothetical protein